MASRETKRDRADVRQFNAADTPYVAAQADNGPQQGFATGATRSTDTDKIDYEGHLHPDVLAVFGEYMHAHRTQRDGHARASDNWQEGIPVYRYVKSLIRHAFEFWRMWRGTPVVNPDSGELFRFRDVLSAILFNTFGVIYELQRQRGGCVLDDTYLPKGARKAYEWEDQPLKTREQLENEARPKTQRLVSEEDKDPFGPGRMVPAEPTSPWRTEPRVSWGGYHRADSPGRAVRSVYESRESRERT